MRQVELRLALENACGDKFPPLVWVGYDVGVPGLAVCKSPKWDAANQVFEEAYRKWRVVHVGSGWRVGKDYTAKTHAEVMATALAGLADWTQPMETLLAQPGLREVVETVLYGNR